jgi:hypothetical protein
MWSATLDRPKPEPFFTPLYITYYLVVGFGFHVAYLYLHTVFFQKQLLEKKNKSYMRLLILYNILHNYQISWILIHDAYCNYSDGRSRVDRVVLIACRFHKKFTEEFRDSQFTDRVVTFRIRSMLKITFPLPYSFGEKNILTRFYNYT